MRIEVRQILTMKLNQATCHLLIMGDVYILLDCGISPSFDFQIYRSHESLIKKVSIILISHSSIQYLGALPFILSQFKIKPQIFTTKPIAELGPINIHEALLYLRHPKYTADVYVRICNMLQQTSLKPRQKKIVRINNQVDKKHQSADSIYLTCYNIGNTIGSVCWRISYFMFNCLYLIGYNNYSEYHLLGMDVETIVSDRINLVITDCYQEEKDEKDRQGMRKEIFKKEIQQKIRSVQTKGKERIIFSCYENERLIELACVLVSLHKQKKIDGKIDFIHLQSLYLQSVKIYPELEFKLTEEDETIFNTRFFSERRMQSKTVITTARSIEPQGLLWNELCVQDPSKTAIIRIGKHNFLHLSESRVHELVELFEPEKEEIVEELMLVDDKKMEIEMEQKQTNMKDGDNDVKEIRSDPFIYNNGTFPKFQLKRSNNQFDQYGEQYLQFEDNVVEEVVQEQVAPKLEKRKSSIEERKRILFDLPPINGVDYLSYDVQNTVRFTENITNFQSSINVLTKIKAQKNVFINCDNKAFAKYQNRFRMLDKKIQLFGMHKRPEFFFDKPYEVIDLPVKLYKQPSDQFKSLAHINLSDIQAVKVDGELVQIGSQLEIRLQKGEEKELKDFSIAKFYKSIKKKGVKTRFTENGAVEIEGIKLSLKKGQIHLDGMYSRQYFELRDMLYEYIESL